MRHTNYMGKAVAIIMDRVETHPAFTALLDKAVALAIAHAGCVGKGKCPWSAVARMAIADAAATVPGVLDDIGSAMWPLTVFKHAMLTQVSTVMFRAKKALIEAE